MSEIEKIKKWLKFAILLSPEVKSEFFYFDKTNDEFFSILNIDYFLFDKKKRIIKGISPYYTQKELEILKKRIYKINKKSNSIIEIPKLGILEDEKKIEQQTTHFLELNKINLEKVKLLEIIQKDILPDFHKKTTKIKRWWEIWKKG